jgi:hypothetical protein
MSGTSLGACTYAKGVQNNQIQEHHGYALIAPFMHGCLRTNGRTWGHRNTSRPISRLEGYKRLDMQTATKGIIVRA